MRVALVVRGTVQGVGFRPFVNRTAVAHGLFGFVRNGRDGVRIEVQGPDEAVAAFTTALHRDLPAPAVIGSIERTVLEDGEPRAFAIVESDGDAAPAPVLPPDLATCAECRREVEDPRDRRYRYPFTNCVACGPRFSICLGLPYDRARTSMAGFVACPDCAREYADANDRRFHAQPIACPACGPELVYEDAAFVVRARGDAALALGLDALSAGKIVALRGLGGFQLLCLASDARAVERLRARKRRPFKPFAVMFRDLAAVRRAAELSDAESDVLSSPAAPIVLVARRSGDGELVESVAPTSPYVGALLPSTPLHALLLESAPGPLVCTSGNLSEEPICISDEEAAERLGGVADAFLTHDRAVVRPLDDSLVRVYAGQATVLRRARGYAPKAVAQVRPDASVVAFGAHLKNTLTLGHRGALVPSQHLGDLDAPSTRDLVQSTLKDLLTFFDAEPRLVACDRHPDYGSTALAEAFAAERGLPLLRVQHHHAHVAACMAEHGVDDEPVLGLAWDGTGLGDDGTIWGSEALVCRGAAFERFAHLEPFPLAGGDRSARDPRSAALGLLFAHAPEHIEELFAGSSGSALRIQQSALAAGVNAPSCSSVGRLFDAVSGLLGAGPVTFEGEAAMRLEAMASRAAPEDAYELALTEGEGRLRSLVLHVCADIRGGIAAERIARRFHEALVRFGVAAAEHANISRVALTGGCMQNRLLAEGLATKLADRGFEVLLPRSVPANDGGVSVGQAWLASHDPRSF